MAHQYTAQVEKSSPCQYQQLSNCSNPPEPISHLEQTFWLLETVAMSLIALIEGMLKPISLQTPPGAPFTWAGFGTLELSGGPGCPTGLGPGLGGGPGITGRVLMGGMARGPCCSAEVGLAGTCAVLAGMLGVWPGGRPVED